MRPVTITQNSVGISAPHFVDRNQSNFKLSLTLDITGVATASVQVTSDLLTDFTDATDFNTNAAWFDVLDMAAVTANVQGNVFFPVNAIRLNTTAFTSGDVKLTVLQSND